MPDITTYFNPITYLQIDQIVLVGYGFIHLSFIWIFIAQRNMANEWRVGIDKENKVNLVKKGLFRISRNPIFLGVIIVFLGLFFILPNIVTAIILISGTIVIQVQVRLEEEFLLKELGDEYKKYMNETMRWLI